MFKTWGIIKIALIIQAMKKGVSNTNRTRIISEVVEPLTEATQKSIWGPKQNGWQSNVETASAKSLYRGQKVRGKVVSVLMMNSKLMIRAQDWYPKLMDIIICRGVMI